MPKSIDLPVATGNDPHNDGNTDRLIRDFEETLAKLEASRPFGKYEHQNRLLAQAAKLLQSDAGVQALYSAAPRFDPAGVFMGGDWAEPQHLQADMVRTTLNGGGTLSIVECLSELRLLALARGGAVHPSVSAADAHAFLEDVLARNLDIPFPAATEESRIDPDPSGRFARLFTFILEHLGSSGILDVLATECERMLLQRPIMVQRVEAILHSASQILSADSYDENNVGVSHLRVMMDALRGPTALTYEIDDPAEYAAALSSLTIDALMEEAAALGHRMNETGLVCRLHATLLRYLITDNWQLLPAALALTRTGEAALAEHAHLIRDIIDSAVTPETARCVYGLSRLLNRGILFFQPVGPGLRRLLVTPIHPEVGTLLQEGSGLVEPPEAKTLLLAGTLSVIGQPRGVDQGHNPTCQSARAISLWSLNDVGYLLEVVVRAARDNELIMHFEGDSIRSSQLELALAEELHTELDPVSLVLTPHLDKIYMEMGRRTIGRGGDGHKWINPEFHGWWVHRGFASLVDPESGGIRDCDGFIRLFHATYHPLFNGGRDLVYAQPCGIASTTARGEFVGWHAVAILRVAMDPAGIWRVYFFNPNHDKGQDWGQDIVTSTSDCGEWEGESSLPFEQFLMRLYVFHYKRSEVGSAEVLPEAVVGNIRTAIAESWGEGRAWLDAVEPGV